MRRPKFSSIASLVAIALVAVVGAVYLLFGVAKVKWFTESRSAVMVIPDAAQIVANTPVLRSGLRVGQVTSAHNTAEGVEVRFDLDSGQQLPVDSVVVIEALSGLGEPYIDFQPRTGNGPYIQDGQLIHSQTVRTPKSLPEVASTVTSLMQQFDPKAVGSIVDTVAKTLAGTDQFIPQLSRSSDLLAATLLSREPQIRALLTNLQVPGPDVAVAGSQMTAAGPTLVDFGAKVHGIIDEINRLIEARPVPDAYVNGNGLLPFIDKLTAVFQRITPDLQRLYPVVQPLLQRAGKVFDGADLSALIGQAVNSVSPDGAVRLEISVK